ncbi:bifunctional NADP phosphatase/NAD kinase [Methanococcus aeolicus]|uniref:bifunctional NADP phosphatase/NAD kinase n=1 Tax=Methanococcus aeolicus TaxID=42879 RepID=UPI0021C92572|nr:bifunctional NADP phosphatase/NAD kinase [Methanococcus aeolicus]UXM85245.1 bifunctional NADP phosphatase/NAD kinase [Methanococcus aeolicus]
MDMITIAMNIAKNIEKGVKPLIGWEKGTEIVKIGADGTPTKRIDLIAEDIAINSIEKQCSAILISEEIGHKQIGDNPQYVIVLDPIDGTYNALNDIPIYSVSIAICKLNDRNIDELTINDLEVGVVRNISTGEVYFAKKGSGAFVFKNNIQKRIYTSKITNLSDASVGVFAYGLTTNTLDFIKDRRVKRIRIFGSAALELCFVARGSLDAFINVNETTRLCDIAGGFVVLKEAGGIISDRDGRIINMPLNINAKNSFICSNDKLHKKFVSIFGNKWKLKPTKFGIVSRADKKEAIELVYEIINYLDSKNIDYELEQDIYNKIYNINNNIENKDKYLMKDVSEISHMISIGGDGTVLRTSRIIGGNEIPIITVNKGTVGFLTEFDVEDIFDIIEDIINGDYEIEKRTKCSGYIKYKDNNQKTLPSALNELVITTKSPAKMIQFEVYVNGNFVEEIRADGLIISTPTGSTAYSLSAGGPIVEPQVDGFVIVPICPFKLFSRPIVINGSSEIKIKIIKKETLVAVDGTIEGELKKGDEIILRKSDSYTYFVKGRNFYETLRKLSVIDGGAR